MSIVSGTRFGPYEVGESIGRGGMGEVYRATDTNLKRDVAIKVLPDSFVDDVDRLARFQREAEVLASLNHANIAQIYGLEKADGKTVIVMELVEGPTLADRIEAGPIRPDEALGIAQQVAGALEAAHAAQVVHRDLKPANVKLKPDGTVKVLDFGIAKALDAESISGGRSPVMTTPAVTETGVILGTAAYMSPEQARGMPVDQRTDIWAFGCLLFEMLTGQPAFGGDDVMSTLARVIDRDTDLSSMPGTIGPAVVHTIKLCLEKNPNKRIADIRDVRLALAGAFGIETGAASDHVAAPVTPARRAIPVTVTALVTALAAVAVAVSLWPAPPSAPLNRFSYTMPPDLPLAGQAVRVIDVSPDGRAFAFTAAMGLHLRTMGELEARLIPGSNERTRGPVFSPDSTSLAYFSADTRNLFRIPVSGGAPVLLGPLPAQPLGMSWSETGEILFGSLAGIFRIAAAGGTPELLIETGPGEGFAGPQRLPESELILFSIVTSPTNFDTGQVVVQSLATGERTVVINGGSDGRYLPSGHLIYTSAGGLFAVAFDPARPEAVGGAVPVLQDVRRAGGVPDTNYGVANDGTLVYVAGDREDVAGVALVWVDREGREEPFGLGPRNYGFVRVSPDGRRIAALINDGGGADIWVSDVDRPVLSRIGSGRSAFLPLWTPAGDSIVTTANSVMFSALADGTGEVEELVTLEGNGFLSAESWSPTGEIVFTYGSVPDPRIGVLNLEPDSNGRREWRPLIDRSSGASMLAVSPDGQWIAYQSSDTGAYAVYIEQFPELGNRQTISDEAGGWGPVWSPAGDELFYRRLGDGAMMAVSIQTSPTLEIGRPEVLFDSQGYMPLSTPQAGGAAGRIWDVAPDGRFLMTKAFSAGTSNEIIIVQNWLEELKRLVPID